MGTVRFSGQRNRWGFAVKATERHELYSLSDTALVRARQPQIVAGVEHTREGQGGGVGAALQSDRQSSLLALSEIGIDRIVHEVAAQTPHPRPTCSKAVDTRSPAGKTQSIHGPPHRPT